MLNIKRNNPGCECSPVSVFCSFSHTHSWSTCFCLPWSQRRLSSGQWKMGRSDTCHFQIYSLPPIVFFYDISSLFSPVYWRPKGRGNQKIERTGVSVWLHLLIPLPWPTHSQEKFYILSHWDFRFISAISLVLLCMLS